MKIDSDKSDSRLSLIEEVKDIAIQAGKITLKYFRCESSAIAYKSDDSPLTEADLESHQLILNRLINLNLSIPMISEEGQCPSYEIRKSWDQFWLVDPLDGTKEFIRGNDEFTVNIALIASQEPVLGVIYVPRRELLYFSTKHSGSWKQVGRETPHRIYSSSPNASEGLIVVESKSHPSKELEAYLNDLPVKKRVSAGSSLKFCLVAEGLADIYPRMGPTMEWDVAAGDCIFRNSARVGQRESPLTYNKESLRNESFVIGLR